MTAYSLKTIMKIFSPILIFIALTGTPAYGDDLQDGMDAFIKGTHGNRNGYEKAFKLVKPYADKGDAAAQNLIGELYQHGRFVKQDLPKAVKLFRLSADQGNHHAQHSLGVMYQNGRGVKPDILETAKLFKLSAKQANRNAQHALGLMYQNGQGVKQDPLEAIKWILKSAKSGYSNSQKSLRQINHLKWVKLAAEQADINAQTFMGASYYLGLNVAKNYTEAAKWYTKAAEQGSVVAQNIIGAMNEKGKGVPEDYAKAAMWYTLSEKSGDHYGRIYKENIEKRMDPAQIAVARKLTQKWLDEHAKKSETQ